MAVSVVEHVNGAASNFVATYELTLAAVPVAGDVVVLRITEGRAGTPVTGVAGLGATWTKIANSNDAEQATTVWMGVGATAAGVVTATMSGANWAVGGLTLVRGLAATTVSALVNAANASGANLSSVLSAGRGQFVFATGFSQIMTAFAGSAPAAGWTNHPIVTLATDHDTAEAYRIPADTENHQTSMTNSGSTVGSHIILSIGDIIPPAPNPPENLEQTDSTESSVTVAWEAPSTGTAPTSYEVRIDGGAAVDVGLVLSTTLEDLAGGGSYLVEVRSVVAGESGTSDWVSVTATTDQLPSRRLVWDQVGEKIFETGVDRGVLYPKTGPGVAWNGLISVSENVSGGELEQLHFDGVKYLDIIANEEFQATLEAFSSPPEFAACDGSKQLSPGLFVTQQPRKTFGLCYRTLIANDIAGVEYGYKLHLVYNATASPSARASGTIGNLPDPIRRTWTINTVPVPAITHKPTAHFVIDSTKVDPYQLADLESYLYGRNGVYPALPPQDEVIAILANVITEPLGEFI